MNGEWLPSGWLNIQPVWLNFFENPIMIQFTHRAIGLLVFISIVACFVSATKQRFRTAKWLLLCIMLAQIALGISTLLLQVPLVLGAAHQGGAVALLSAALFVAHLARKNGQYA